MPKANIKTKTGMVITIDGTKEDIAQILGEFEKVSAVREVKQKISKKNVEKREEGKRCTASGLIIELREEGFFAKPKTLKEIAESLEKMGYIYPTTTLSSVVIGLVQKKLLGRKKADGRWVYGR